MTSADLPGGRPGATSPGMPPGWASGGKSDGGAESTQPVRTPVPSFAGPPTEAISPSDYAGSFGGPTLAAPVSTPRRPEVEAVVAPPVRLGARRARLTIRRVDPWSVLKFTLLFSVCMLVIGVVAVAALYAALDKLEVFKTIHDFVLDQTGSGQGATRTGGFEITFRARWFIGGAALLGAVNTVIFTALATLGAFLYNLCSDIVGGIEVVLGERD